MAFPEQRLRRLRQNNILRESLQNIFVRPQDLVQPYFVLAGDKVKNPIKKMPGQYQFSPDTMAKEIEKNLKAGLNKVILFGVISEDEKDHKSSGAYDRRGVIPTAVEFLKTEFGKDLFVITDVCACEYTDHGHCGVVDEDLDDVDNDETLNLLGDIALTHVQAGADMVAPSDMMDGRVAAIRRVLDEDEFKHIPILSYAVKYASNLYGPFREAAGSDQFKGTRKTYQMDFRRDAREALHEAALDVAEGADMLMVKPAGFYLDIISEVSKASPVPLAAYQVSGEYGMLLAASQVGVGNLPDLVLEALMACKRAGAQWLVTYFANQVIEKGWGAS
jgi:porphobilinogen synthase